MIARGAFLAAAAAAAALPSTARAQSSTALTIGYVPTTLFAPIFVAAERGYLRDAGFDVSLTQIVAGADAMALVAQGRLDVVAAAASGAFFNAVNRGFEVKFVGSTGYQPHKGHPSALLIRADLYAAGVRDPSGLRGRKVGSIGGPGAASQYYIARILRGHGLRLRDIEDVNIANPDQEVALANHAIDAVFTSSPFPDLLERKNLARIIGAPPPGISASGIFFGPTLLHDAARARAVMSALRRAATDVTGSGYYAPANLTTYSKYTHQPVTLLAAADRYDFKPDLRVDLGTLQDMQTVFVEQGFLTYASPLNEVRLVARF